ncbi:MAG: methyltransferase domain-containing protein [Nanoarchaeota archaeon]|nr:methyltransferase domain-containing protein [Nanoarchaeota archaeon]MBU1269450.1 methyltransferase domain-containing protein [Nanoarchaeota archaeon]MBU1604607.1 methyltransferase domain-containing protein [Nanoarchaeota archaeon]MBU2442757.1 methyltransferase domain-containing protein [Nanoarchaeota archaeon]
MKQNTKNYWDCVEKKIKKHHLEENIAWYKKKEYIKLITAWCNQTKNKTILKTDLFEEMLITDSFYDWLQKNFKKAIGIDISLEIVKHAKKNFKRGYFLTKDVRDTSFKKDTFDVIISNSTLDHFPEKDLITALKELRRILKPTGTLILTLDNKENKRYYFFYIINKQLRLGQYWQERCYSLKEIQKIMASIGFEILDVKGLIHIPTPFNKVALMLKKVFGRKANFYINKKIRQFDSKQNKLKTAWQIAIKAKKK